VNWIAVGSGAKGRISCDVAGIRTAILVHPLLIITVRTELLRLVSSYTKSLRGSNEKLAVPASPLLRFAWPLTNQVRTVTNFI